MCFAVAPKRERFFYHFTFLFSSFFFNFPPDSLYALPFLPDTTLLLYHPIAVYGYDLFFFWPQQQHTALPNRVKIGRQSGDDRTESHSKFAQFSGFYCWHFAGIIWVNFQIHTGGSVLSIFQHRANCVVHDVEIGLATFDKELFTSSCFRVGLISGRLSFSRLLCEGGITRFFNVQRMRDYWENPDRTVTSFLIILGTFEERKIIHVSPMMMNERDSRRKIDVRERSTQQSSSWQSEN